MTGRLPQILVFPAIVAVVVSTFPAEALSQEDLSAAEFAAQALQAARLSGGLIVHLGCGSGEVTAALGNREAFLVHGLDHDPERIAEARARIASLGLCGRVSVERHTSHGLPYADNLVNLVVAEEPGVADEEIGRVLAPGGTALIRLESGWRKIVKPWPDDIDQWSHFLHGPDGNAVANDRRVGPPRHIQWVAGPRWARAHEQLASTSALVSSGGRIFSIVDEAPIASIAFPGQWSLVARDAFNGVVLWKRPIAEWEDHRRDFRSGPVQLARRLVAVGDRVYATLGFRAKVSVLDAATGETIHVMEGTESAQEILVGTDLVLVAIGDPAGDVAAEAAQRRGEQVAPVRKRIVAWSPGGGTVLWERTGADAEQLMPLSLALGEGKVVLQNFTELVCLDAKTGEDRWRSPRPVSLDRPAWSAPTVVIRDGVVLSADRAAPQDPPKELPGTVAWEVNLQGGGVTGELIAFSAESGKRLWSCPAGENYNAPVDVFVADGLVWVGETARRGKTDFTVGRNLKTGEVERQIDTAEAFERPGMPHHRCYRNKATDRFLLVGRVGVELIDLEGSGALRHHWVRGTCQYGVMPANGLLYAPPHSCACYIKGKLDGFHALAASRTRRDLPFRARDVRLEKGPAYGSIESGQPAPGIAWPTYRGDAARSGSTPVEIGGAITPGWTVNVGGRLSSLTSDGKRVLVASIDEHTVHCLSAADGSRLWQFTAGGRIDSPPTLEEGAALFGAADGWVYCLRAEDGELAWRFRAAPEERRVVAYDRVESVWPVAGSVLVEQGVVYAAAGRSSFLDGGIHLVRLDAETGALLSETVVHDLDETGRQPEDSIQGFEMEGALPDVLSCDGSSVFMRHLRFDLSGTRQDEPVPHLFSPTGLLDDSWWHRSYWILGDRFHAGWGGWWKIGAAVPSGRILSITGDAVYGFGRDRYPGGNTGQWRGGERYHLFAMGKEPSPQAPAAARRGQKPAEVPEKVFYWSEELPIWAKGLVVAGRTIVAAGPPEPKLDPDNPLALESVEDAAASLEGRRGGMLYAVSADDGVRRAELPLAAPPVFDGIIAAAGKVFLADTEGNVVCFYGSSP